MPTAQDLRRWLKGEDVEGLPERDEVWEGSIDVKSNPFNFPAKICSRCQGSGTWSGDRCTGCDGHGWVPKSNELVDNLKQKHRTNQERHKYSSSKYKISADGQDAILWFGRHNGYSVSDLAKTEDGRSYLKWILGQEFDVALKDICAYQLRQVK